MIQTNLFRLNLPKEWNAEMVGNQLHISGQENDLLILSISSIPGSGNENEFQKTLDQLEQDALVSMREVARDPQLDPPQGPVLQTLADGTTFHMMTSFTKDKSYFLVQYCLKGPRTILLATYEGPAAAGVHVAQVSRSLKEIVWLQQPET